jgi:hypothetical protein
MKITPDDVKAVYYATRDISSRYSTLKFVRLRPGEMAASNGHILIIREMPCDKEVDVFDECFLDPEKIAKVVKRPCLMDATDHFMIVFTDLTTRETFTIPKEDAPGYPLLEKAVPSKNRRGQNKALFDPEVLIAGLRAMKGAENVELRLVDDKSAIRLDGTLEDGSRALAVVMPVVQS